MWWILLALVLNEVVLHIEKINRRNMNFAVLPFWKYICKHFNMLEGTSGAALISYGLGKYLSPLFCCWREFMLNIKIIFPPSGISYDSVLNFWFLSSTSVYCETILNSEHLVLILIVNVLPHQLCWRFWRIKQWKKNCYWKKWTNFNWG